ncbi:glycosyltransferase family 2 protein [Psychrobacter glacincola]|uniref:Glycosyltransferase family 2 protein n=1 Tax=Psychrobacter glacincola TaxID=56810 RepID=A0ABW1W8M4_9GAMM|nr:glycosyltransferase [Psychrobacter glacincola]
MIISPKVSIIIPVYNGEQFLERCLESISSQSYKDIEIIIINDGSTDNTKTLCDNYLLQEPRARVIHKKNGGVSIARNLGLDLAIGAYIYFVDADDYVLKNGIKNLVNKAVENLAELVVAEYYVAYGENKNKVSPSVLKNSDDFLCSILSGGSHSALWNKLFSRNLFNEIRFPIDIRYIEDKVLVSQLLLVYQPKIEFLNTPVYVYCQDEHSVTNSKDLRMLDIFVAYICIERYLNKFTEGNNVIESFASSAYKAVWTVLMTIDNQYLKEAIVKAKHHTKVMSKYRDYSVLPLKVRLLLLSLKLPVHMATPIIASMRKGLNQLSSARRQARR